MCVIKFKLDRAEWVGRSTPWSVRVHQHVVYPRLISDKFDYWAISCEVTMHTSCVSMIPWLRYWKWCCSHPIRSSSVCVLSSVSWLIISFCISRLLNELIKSGTWFSIDLIARISTDTVCIPKCSRSLFCTNVSSLKEQNWKEHFCFLD